MSKQLQFPLWFSCHSFRMCRPTIWNKLPYDLWNTDTREQFKCRLKGWLFECAHGGGTCDRRWL